MKHFKQLIRNKKFFVFILSSFLLISGIITLLFGLGVCYPALSSVNDPNAIMFTVFVLILGAIVSFAGYMLPLTIVKLDEEKEMKRILMEKKKKEIIQKIQGIRLATVEEKEFFIKKNKMITNYFLSTVRNVMAAAVITGLIYMVIDSNRLLIWLNSVILFGSIFILISLRINYTRGKIIKELVNRNMYIADCYAYERKKEKEINLRDSTFRYIYLIKVTDGNYYIDQWFRVGYKDFKKETINVTLYIAEGMDVFHIRVKQ